MKTRNSCGIKFDVANLQSQIESHVAFMRDSGKKKYTIQTAMKKCGVGYSSFFNMIKRGAMSEDSAKKFSKLKIADKNITVKMQ